MFLTLFTRFSLIIVLIALNFLAWSNDHFCLNSSQTKTQNKAFPIASQKNYLNLTAMVNDLGSSSLTPQNLIGDIIPIPSQLGLRDTLTEGRMIRYSSGLTKPKAIVFFVSGLFNSGEVVASRNHFIKEQTHQGVDVIHLEVSQGYTAAREILNNNGESPFVIPHEEQQTLLAFYILSALKKYNIAPDIPKSLVGHSYGGWLVNRFMSTPQWNGQASIINPELNRILLELENLGYNTSQSFNGFIQTMILLDSGIGSLHFLHPAFAEYFDFGFERLVPLLKHQMDQYLATLMRQSMKKRKPKLNQDYYSLENGIALYLGIRTENMIHAALDIPIQYKIFDLVAGKSELIPLSWHKSYAATLDKTSEGPEHRSSLILDEAPHDLLPLEGVGLLVGQLSSSSWLPNHPITSVRFKNKAIFTKGIDSFPPENAIDMTQQFWEAQMKMSRALWNLYLFNPQP